MHHNSIPTTTNCVGHPDPKQRHFEVYFGSYSQMARDPLAVMLNDEGFSMLPQECGFDSQLFPVNDCDFFEVDVVVDECELVRKYPVVINCGPGFIDWFWIHGAAGYEQVMRDAAFVMREHIGMCIFNCYEPLRFISRGLQPHNGSRNIMAFLQ
jgi:hypothetical protein